ncbi:MAG: hypothetical protein EAY69_03375 [Cytophagales bacterium]|nr:MAG: hypothetical protein EAY69_03375 [Cytophagales bacterium]
MKNTNNVRKIMFFFIFLFFYGVYRLKIVVFILFKSIFTIYSKLRKEKENKDLIVFFLFFKII